MQPRPNTTSKKFVRNIALGIGVLGITSLAGIGLNTLATQALQGREEGPAVVSAVQTVQSLHVTPAPAKTTVPQPAAAKAVPASPATKAAPANRCYVIEDVTNRTVICEPGQLCTVSNADGSGKSWTVYRGTYRGEQIDKFYVAGSRSESFICPGGSSPTKTPLPTFPRPATLLFDLDTDAVELKGARYVLGKDGKQNALHLSNNGYAVYRLPGETEFNRLTIEGSLYPLEEGYGTIVSASSAQSEELKLLHGPNDPLYVEVRVGGVRIGPLGSRLRIRQSQWADFSVVYNGQENYIRIYTNGVLNGEEKIVKPTMRLVNFVINKPTAGSFARYNGLLDNLKIYSDIRIP